MKIGEILNGERGGLFLTVPNPPRFYPRLRNFIRIRLNPNPE